MGQCLDLGLSFFPGCVCGSYPVLLTVCAWCLITCVLVYGSLDQEQLQFNSLICL